LKMCFLCLVSSQSVASCYRLSRTEIDHMQQANKTTLENQEVNNTQF